MLPGARFGVRRISSPKKRRTTMAGESQESRNVAVLVWIGTIFFGFVPSLIVYLIKKDDAYVLDQSKEALNWAITALIGVFAGAILTIIFIGVLLLIVVGLASLIFCIMGAVAASNGQQYRVPFAIRLIK
jgi:uncharacterized Tic20 family protein